MTTKKFSVYRAFFWLAVFAILLFSFWSLRKVFFASTLQDFRVYYLAAQDVKLGKNPYLNDQNNFIYPPSAFVFLLPLIFLNYPVAIFLWTFGSTVSLLLTVFLFTQFFYHHFSAEYFFSLLCLALLSFPFKFTLGMGQMNLYVLLFTTLSVFLFQKEKSVLAGISLGIAIGAKLFPILFLLFFLRKKNVRLTIASVITFVLLHALPLFLYGQKILQLYYTDLIFKMNSLGNWAYYNQSLAGLLARLHASLPLTQILILFAVGLFFAMTILTMSSQKRSASMTIIEYSLLVCSWLITEGVSWQHYFVFLLFPFAGFLYMTYERKISKRKITAVLMSYFLISTNIKDFSKTFPFDFLIYSHVLLGTVLLFLILMHEATSNPLY